MLSGQTSSDPLVIQVGRLLRTMLMGKEAPPELRLLLSQATFELPIFESIEDVDRALAQLNKLDEPGPAGLALLRAVAAPPPPPAPKTSWVRPAADTADPSHEARNGTGGTRQSPIRVLLGGYSSHVAAIFAAIARRLAFCSRCARRSFPSEAPATVERRSSGGGKVARAGAGPALVTAGPATGTGICPASQRERRTSNGRLNGRPRERLGVARARAPTRNRPRAGDRDGRPDRERRGHNRRARDSVNEWQSNCDRRDRLVRRFSIIGSRLAAQGDVAPRAGGDRGRVHGIRCTRDDESALRATDLAT